MAPAWKSVRAEAAAREAQSDPAPSGWRSFGLGIGERSFGVGRHGIGGMLTAAAEAERGASPWGSESLASGHEHLHDAREFVLRAGGVGGTEGASYAEDVEGGGALHGRALRDGEEVMTIALGPARGPRRGSARSKRRHVRSDREGRDGRPSSGRGPSRRIRARRENSRDVRGREAGYFRARPARGKRWAYPVPSRRRAQAYERSRREIHKRAPATLRWSSPRSGVIQKSGTPFKRHGLIAALTGQGGDGDLRGGPPPHPRDVATDVTAAT